MISGSIKEGHREGSSSASKTSEEAELVERTGTGAEGVETHEGFTREREKERGGGAGRRGTPCLATSMLIN